MAFVPSQTDYRTSDYASVAHPAPAKGTVMKTIGRWLLFLVSFICVGVPALILGALWEYAAAHFEAGRLFVSSTQTAGPRTKLYR